MRFEDAVSESTVFVVSERQSVLNVLDLSSGMEEWSPNHYERSV